jgi:hypothetical protein
MATTTPTTMPLTEVEILTQQRDAAIARAHQRWKEKLASNRRAERAELRVTELEFQQRDAALKKEREVGYLHAIIQELEKQLVERRDESSTTTARTEANAHAATVQAETRCKVMAANHDRELSTERAKTRQALADLKTAKAETEHFRRLFADAQRRAPKRGAQPSTPERDPKRVMRDMATPAMQQPPPIVPAPRTEWQQVPSSLTSQRAQEAGHSRAAQFPPSLSSTTFKAPHPRLPPSLSPTRTHEAGHSRVSPFPPTFSSTSQPSSSRPVLSSPPKRAQEAGHSRATPTPSFFPPAVPSFFPPAVPSSSQTVPSQQAPSSQRGQEAGHSRPAQRTPTRPSTSQTLPPAQSTSTAPATEPSSPRKKASVKAPVTSRDSAQYEAPSGVVACRHCREYYWGNTCDNGEPCRNCKLSGATECERIKCADFDDCKRSACRHMHARDEDEHNWHYADFKQFKRKVTIATRKPSPVEKQAAQE